MSEFVKLYNFMSTSTYPDYDKAKNLFKRIEKFIPMNYSNSFHLLCANLYAHIENDSQCKKIGENIHTLFGFDGLQAACYMLSDIIMYSTKDSTLYCNITSRINSVFDGIGEWEE
jgi:hypothetical protein